MRRPIATTLLLLGLALLCHPSASGQARGRPQPIRLQAGSESDVADAIRTASALLRQGEINAAIELLEPLLEKHPGEPRLIHTLGEAYQRTLRYDLAIGLYRSEITRSGGRSPELWSLLVNAQQRADQCSDAIDTLLEVFSREPGWLHRFRDQLELIVTDSTCATVALQHLETRVAREKGPPPWREALGQAYVMLEKDQEALAVYTQLDRLRPDRGQAIFDLARDFVRQDKIEAAAAAYDSVLSISANRKTIEQALFDKAGLLVRLGRFPEAAQLFTRLIEQRSPTPLSMRAELARADLYMGPLDDLARAQASYQSVLANLESRRRDRSHAAIREEARLALAECAMRRGQFDKADSMYAELVRESPDEKTKERCAFELGQLRFFQGDLADAEAAYYELTDNYPLGDWVNDALAQALLIGEFGMRSPKALNTFAQAIYERRRGDLKKAETICTESLADTSLVLMRDHLRMLQMQVVGEQDRWSEADSLLSVLLEKDPDTRVAARALLWMGERAEAELLMPDEAGRYYEEIILRYPDSFETRQARDRLQALRSRAEES